MRARDDTERDAISFQEPEKEQEEVRAPAGGGPDGRRSSPSCGPSLDGVWELMVLLAGMAGCVTKIEFHTCSGY